ncbi:MAG: 23S rRNA (guanosine(2251)-2'-O)-methyltransferase RlmB, partial [Ignavibacteria bacterium]|nr:23S rRNA (guanosine(2251)-2'-O)-methyltransferase RlmB [Ignavibacteria bacterium]
AAKLIPIAKETNLVNSIRYLKQNGFTIIGADTSTNNLVYEVDMKKSVGLILGSEGKGLRQGIRGYCDLLIRIPIIPKIDSLNVSVSSGIFLYEIFRQKNV